MVGCGWGRLASPQGHSVCLGHLFGLDPAACPSVLYKAESVLDPAEPRWGDLTVGRGPDARFGTLVRGLGLLSLEGLSWGTYGPRRPLWPP